MKSNLLKFSIASLILLIVYGCNKQEMNADYPGLTIYKTKGDYFNLIDVGIKNNQVFREDHFWNPRYNTMNGMEIIGNDTIYKYRYKLPYGYILDAEADERYDAFLNITFKEQIYREMKSMESMPNDTILKYIIDRNPYIEFYRYRKDLPEMLIEDSLKIKEIILNGEIEKYFKRIN